MGERKGVNMYYPPDYDPRKGGLNKSQGTHALRERAKKLHLGILIIRFEMPYNIWCDGCGLHVGMGVRYNAEKKKIGMYYTTPVYQFRMKCTACPTYYEIKTDPGNLDYVIVSGARRQERRWDPTQNGQVAPDDKETQKKLFDDAMFKLEHGEQDRGKGKEAGPRLGKIVDIQDRVKDDYLANRRMRDQLRSAKNADKARKALDDALLKKSSLNLNLLPESSLDARAASLLKLTPAESSEERQSKQRGEIDDESIFARPSTSRTGASKKEMPKNLVQDLALRHKEKLTKAKASPMRKGIGVIVNKRKGLSSSSSSSSSSSMATEEDLKKEMPVEAMETLENKAGDEIKDGENAGINGNGREEKGGISTIVKNMKGEEGKNSESKESSRLKEHESKEEEENDASSQVQTKASEAKGKSLLSSSLLCDYGSTSSSEESD